jgi:WD40 repeat protein
VYASGLIFSPARSITRIQFETQQPVWIIRKPKMEQGWSTCLQTLEGHNNAVNSVVFSHDSKLLASASEDRTIKVWDAGSGQCLQTLEGHSYIVSSVVFSHDSKLLALASDDYTVKVWDAGSGQCLQTLEGHSNTVSSVVFSHDSKLLASASYDHTIKVWDAGSGQCLHTFNNKRITSVKSFDSTNSYLETDIGTICLSSVSERVPTNTNPEVTQFKGYSVSSDGTWITWNLENILWLPPEYRSHTCAMSLSAICLGCSSGRVLFFTFDSSRLLDVLAGHSIPF